MKEKGAFMIFFAIVLVVNLLVNAYIYSRTRAIFPTGNFSYPLAAVLFWLLALSYMIGRITERMGYMEFAHPFVHLGSYWMGAMLYLTLLFLLTDIFRGFVTLVPAAESFRFGWNTDKGRVAIVTLYAATTVILTFGYYFAKSPVVRFQQIAVDKPLIGGPLRAVLVSDLHLGMMISNGRLERLVELVNAQKPDVLLLAGDVFDEDLGPVIENNLGDLLKNFKTKYGAYAVLGNHEFYGDAQAAREYLEHHNIKVLRDSVVRLYNGTTIIGREDITHEQMNRIRRKPIDELISASDTSGLVILIDHQPYNLNEVVGTGVDLQVSGHTHHGQMWPLNYITKAIFTISRGYGKLGNTHFFVSSGFGTWGPPFRTNSRSEIVVLDIAGAETM